MCHQVTCKICTKPTWSGCGNHIEQALAGVPKSQRCQGHSDAETAQFKSENSFFKRMFARS